MNILRTSLGTLSLLGSGIFYHRSYSVAVEQNLYNNPLQVLQDVKFYFSGMDSAFGLIFLSFAAFFFLYQGRDSNTSR